MGISFTINCENVQIRKIVRKDQSYFGSRKPRKTIFILFDRSTKLNSPPNSIYICSIWYVAFDMDNMPKEKYFIVWPLCFIYINWACRCIFQSEWLDADFIPRKSKKSNSWKSDFKFWICIKHYACMWNLSTWMHV